LADRIIQISPMGGLGNRMIQYLAALALGARVPDARLIKIHLPEWGIQIPPEPEQGARIEVVTTDRIPLDRLAVALTAGTIDRVDIRAYAQRMENLLPARAYRGLFRGPEVAGTGPHELLCNIRQGEIVDARHPDYVFVPIEFYADLVAQTGLEPVFMGQLEDSPYMAALHRRFPRARTIPSRGPIADFALIRASVNIVPAVSTFSWLAAWLSEAERIFMPVLGLFHPFQSKSTFLLPLQEPRYRFYLFPYHYAVKVEDFAAAQAPLLGQWRLMPPARLAALLARFSTTRTLELHLPAFDESFYLARYGDVAKTVASGGMPSGRHHFEHYGFNEGREAFAVNRPWYCRTYPIAAFELGQGDVYDVTDHYVQLGRPRGYRRGPEPTANA
jgi:hypothetical protein